MSRRRVRALAGELATDAKGASPAAAPATPLTGLQRGAGNDAVNHLLRRTSVQRCGCGGHDSTEEQAVQRLGFGFLGDLAGLAGELLSGDAEPLDAKTAPACSEKPNWQPEQSIPVDIRADDAGEFVNKMKNALGGHPHMSPSFSWAPDEDKNRVTKLNMTISTKIVRPRFAGGRPTEADRALIAKTEALIKAHEERHRDIAKEFAQKAVCAAFGKSTAGTPPAFEHAVNAVLCAMNKAQEALDHREGTLKWTMDDGGTRVVDVSLAPEPSASYPC